MAPLHHRGEYGHAPLSVRSDRDWRHLGDRESRRGELEEGELEEGALEEEPKQEWRRPTGRRDAPADHRGHDEQPRYASRGNEGRELPNLDH